MSKKEQNDEDLQDDFSTDEFDEIYGDDEPALTDIDSIDVSEVDEVTESDLDFIEEDIEEVFSDDEAEVAEVKDVLEEDSEGEEVADVPAAPKKKKSSFGLALVSLLVLGGGGAGAYFAGMIPGLTPPASLSYQPVATQQTAEETASTGINDDIFADQQTTEQPQQESQQDMEALYAESFSDGEDEVVIEEQNQGFLDSDDEDEMIADDDSGMDMFAAPEPENNSASDPYGEDEIFEEKVAMIEEEPIIEMATPVMPTISTPSANIDSEELSNLASQMNELQGNMNSRLAELENAIKNLPVATSDSGETAQVDLSGIESSIEKLNARLDKMQDEIASVKKTANDAASKAAQVKETASKPAPVKTTPKAEAPKVAATPSWEIRAIQVGKAVIAEKGKSGTRSISVGDSVPGLGTIKDINYKNGGWVIVGSSGSIKQ